MVQNYIIILVSKLHSGTSKTKAGALFWKSHCAICSPVYVILYHVTGSCKEPITLDCLQLVFSLRYNKCLSMKENEKGQYEHEKGLTKSFLVLLAHLAQTPLLKRKTDCQQSTI